MYCTALEIFLVPCACPMLVSIQLKMYLLLLSLLYKWLSCNEGRTEGLADGMDTVD